VPGASALAGLAATATRALRSFLEAYDLKGNGVERWSRLTLAVLPVLDRLAPVPFSAEDRDLLEVLVSDHELDGPEPPGWMVELFEDIAAGRVSRPRRWVSSEYPRA
jgi:hypothetical protein